MLKLMTAAAVLMMAQPASAADWWIILQQDGEGNVHVADTAQLRQEGDHVTFWSHLFYKKAIKGMKSARIQYEVDCATSSMRERRYLDFDAKRNVIGSGDNTDEDGWKEVAPDTSGSAYVSFACSSEEDRKTGHLQVDRKVDIFDTADFFLDTSPIVKVR